MTCPICSTPMLPVRCVLTLVDDSPTLNRRRVARTYYCRQSHKVKALVRRDDYEQCPGCATVLMRGAVI